MLAAIFISLILGCAAVEVEITVTSDSEDGATVFSIKCEVEDYDDHHIASISLYREPLISVSSDASRILVAQIFGLSPRAPFAGPGFERLTVRGEIDYQLDLETFLEVLLVKPRTEDLGLYTCEAVAVDEDGEEVSFVTAEARLAAVRGAPLAALVSEERILAFVEDAEEIVTETKHKTTATKEETATEPRKTTDTATAILAEATGPVHQAVTIPEETTAIPEQTTPIPEQTTAIPEQTTAIPEQTTLIPEQTTPIPEQTTAISEETMEAVKEITQEETTTIPEETTTPVETTQAVQETTTIPDEITILERTTTIIEETTETLQETTTIPEETAETLQETTMIMEETTETLQETTIPEETTTILAETTETLQETTTILEETTETLHETMILEETTETLQETTTILEETTIPEETTTIPDETTEALQETTILEGTTIPEKTTMPEETTEALQETITILEETIAISEETTGVVQETTTAILVVTTQEDTTAKSTVSSAALVETTETDMDRLSESMQSMVDTLGDFSDTFVWLESRLSELEKQNDNVDDEDVVRNYFSYQNASYFFFKSKQLLDANRAQTACESRRLYLTEVNDAGELQVIADEISPYIIDDGVVLVGGEKKEGEDVWLYQGSHDVVDFFAWGPGEPGPTADSECLALHKSEDSLRMVAVPCSSDRSNFYFLCEEDDD